MGVRRQLKCARLLLAALPFTVGCANTIDTITGKRYKDDIFTHTFYSDDPLEVMRSSNDSTLRAKAMMKIREPKQHGADEKEQFEVLQLLATSATSDKQPICRLRAIEALGRFEDPRTAKILLTAYQTAGQDPDVVAADPEAGVVQAGGRRARPMFTPVSSLTSENIAMIQCKALESLSKKRTPESLALLCEVAAKPAKRDVKPVAGSEPDMTAPATNSTDLFDVRLAAIRGLGNFKGEAAAAHALYAIMTLDTSVAMRSRAHDSLVSVTGQNYPPHAAEWRAYLKITEAAPR